MGGSSSSVPVPVSGVLKGRFVERGKKGEIIDVYIEEATLGVGGFGKVCKVIRERDKNVFALKLIPLSTPNQLRMVQDEIKSLSTLKHDNLVGFVHSFKAETVVADPKDPKIQKVTEAFCVIMEFVEGADLSKLLQRQTKLPVTTVMTWFLKVLEATAYFHAQGCVHRDLKPANILINVDNQMVKIVDFGIAGWIQPGGAGVLDAAQERSLAGTPGFMDPTLVQAWKGGAQKAAVDYSADMWALGVILLQTLTLQNPGFIYENKEDAFKSAALAIKNLDDNSGALKWLLAKMLCPKKDRASAEELLASKEIAAWKIALNPEAKMVTPVLKTEMMPYIATLMQLEVPSPIRAANFDRLGALIQGSSGMGVCAAELNLLNACVLHFDDDSVAGGVSQQHLMLLLLGALLEAGSNPADNDLKSLAAKLAVGVRTNAFKCMYQMLNRSPISLAVVDHFYSISGATDKLWTLATKVTDERIVGVLGLILRHERPVSFSPDYYLQAVLPRNSNNFETLYPVAHVHDNPALLESFLEKLLARVEGVTTPILKLFSECREPMSEWVNFKQVQQQLGAVIYFAMHAKDFSKDFKDFMTHGIRHALPNFNDLTRACVNASLCTHYLSDGIFATQEPLLTCTDCNVSVCLPCVRNCHRGHKLSNGYPIRCNNAPCGCSKACHCRAAPTTAFVFDCKQTEILPEPHTLPACETLDSRLAMSYWRAKDILTITFREAENTAGDYVTEMFRSKGFKFTFSSSQAVMFYFEVNILQAIPRCKLHYLGIGIAPERSKKANHILGLDDQEFGYHSQDGEMHCCSTNSSGTIGPRFGQDDTIGVGVRRDGFVFFTYNGYYLADSTTKLSRSSNYYAAVSSTGFDCKLQFNFVGPFKFQPHVAPTQEQVHEKFSQINLSMIHSMYCGLPEVSAKASEIPAPKVANKFEYPMAVRVEGAGSAEVNGDYKRTTEMMLNVPIFRMTRNDKFYHICRSGSTKTHTKKWWICRADRNGIDKDIDFYTVETDSESPPSTGWTVLKGEESPPVVRLAMKDVGSATKCPNDHTLAAAVATSQTCDQCKNHIPVGQPMSSCRPCDYDICKACKAVAELNKGSGNSAVAVTWPHLFQFVIQTPHPAAGLILWSFFLFEPRVFFAFCDQHPADYEAIAKSSIFVSRLLQKATEMRPSIDQSAYASPGGLIQPIQPAVASEAFKGSEPASPPEQEPVITHFKSPSSSFSAEHKTHISPVGPRRASFQRDFNSPNSSFSLDHQAATSSPVQTSKQEDLTQQMEKLLELNRMLLESRTISTQTRTQLPVPVCVRASDSTTWVEIVIRPTDTLESVRTKICECLGRNVTSLVKLEKVVSAEISVAVTVDHQVGILQSGACLIAYFQAS